MAGSGPAGRRERARALLRERGLDALVATPSPDLTYLAGYRVPPSERLTCLVLRDGSDPLLLVPKLEAPRARSAVGFDIAIATWEETDDPVLRLADALAGARRVAISEQTWAGFVLRLRRALPEPELVVATDVLRSLRILKDALELSALREASAAADRAYARLVADVRFAGRRERDVAGDLGRILREEDHDDVKFAIVGSGPNGASPHHQAGDRIIVDGDVVVCDFGGTREGYCSDLTRTVYVGAGNPPDEVREVYEVVVRAQRAAYAAARVGAGAQEVDRAARRVIAEAGYGEAFVHRTGHGIGLDGHEHPYLIEGNAEPLEVGMAFSIEPGIYLAGRFGVRIEDIVALTPSGAEGLNHADHALGRVR